MLCVVSLGPVVVSVNIVSQQSRVSTKMLKCSNGVIITLVVVFGKVPLASDSPSGARKKGGAYVNVCHSYQAHFS
jgi:hypothetical protein